MSVPYFGDFAEDATVYIPFNTFSSDDPQASVTITNLADADLNVHKDGGTTQIATDGATIAIDYDTITGNHLATIDTSASADYSTGSDYMVRMEGTTVDGATINAWIGTFSIENRFNEVDVVSLAGIVQSLTDLKDFADAGYDPATNKVQGVILVDTTTTNTDMVGTDNAALATALATAQADLDTLTGSDGATLATTQGNYAPSKAGDAMTLTSAATSAQLIDDIWDEIISSSAHATAGSSGNRVYLGQSNSWTSTTVNDASATTTSFVTDLTSAVDNFYQNQSILFVTGALAGQSRIIESYNGTTKAITLDKATTSAVADNVVLALGATHVHPESEIADAVWEEATSGHTTAGSVGQAIIDVLADTNELQTDDVPGLITALNDITTAQVNAEVLDVLQTDTFAELSGVPAATSSLKDKLTWVFMLARNQLEQTATTATIRADNTTTSVATSTVSDDGTTAQRGEFS